MRNQCEFERDLDGMAACDEPAVECIRLMSNGYMWLDASPEDPEPDGLIWLCARHFDTIWSAWLRRIAQFI